MEFEVYSDLDNNFIVEFFDAEKDIRNILNINPKTGKPFSREEAYEYAENIINVKAPKTKLEFFDRLTDDDYANYIEAVSVVKGKFENMTTLADEEKVRIKAQKILISKFEILPDFNFTDIDIETLKTFCKDFDISVVNVLS